MFNLGQRAAVVAVFRMAGYDGPLVTGPIASEDERAFLLERDDLARIRHVRDLEQVLQQLLERKVFVVERTPVWGTPIPFE